MIIGVPLHDQLDAINTGFAYLYSGTTFQPLLAFDNPTPNPGDEFGFAVLALGQKIVIGAPFDSTAGNQTGAVYVFDGVTGALLRTIVNPDATGSKHFGWSLGAVDTNTILVGAPKDNTGLTGGGVVYMCNATTGAVIKVFVNPTPSADDEFGYAVDVVGTTVLIGAPGHDVPETEDAAALLDAGAAYLFDSTTGALVRTIVDPVPATLDRFGQALSKLGADPLVSAPGHGPGAVYRLNAATGAVKNTYVPQGAFGNDAFGADLAIVGGSKIAIGIPLGNLTGQPTTGIVQVFDANSSALLQTISKAVPTQGDEFGYAITVSGASIVVGVPRDDAVDVDSGAVYYFRDNSCGNGTVEGAEQCDDHNVVDGDGCDSNCTLPSCGNGIFDAPARSATTATNRPVTAAARPVPSRARAATASQSPFEQCDDGNTVSGDGCDSNCTITGCGNGLTSRTEQCDDGASNGSDNCCSASCQLIDEDSDGVCDRDDVCPNTPDPAQTNADGDIFGDECDVCPGDSDNDSDGDCTASAARSIRRRSAATIRARAPTRWRRGLRRRPPSCGRLRLLETRASGSREASPLDRTRRPSIRTSTASTSG